MDIANRHKKDLPLVIAVLRLTIAPLERHMTDEGGRCSSGFCATPRRWI